MIYTTVLLVLNFVAITLAAADPQVKDYFIANSRGKCSLLSISANIFVSFNTKDGNKVSEISFDNSPENQNGTCSFSGVNNTSQFIISLNGGDQKLIFNFQDVYKTVVLKEISFIYNLPNVLFPNSTSNGTIIATSSFDTTLSNMTDFYQCLSINNFILANNVTLQIFSIKLKVFDVVNGSFGEKMSQCPKDMLPSSQIPTKSSETSDNTSPLMTSTTINHSSPTTSQPLTSSSVITSRLTSSSFSTQEVTTSLSTQQSLSSSSRMVSTAHTSILSSISTLRPATDSTRNTASQPFVTTISPTDPKFEIKDNTTVCLLLQGQMNFSVVYETTESNLTKKFPITSKLTYNGSCSTDIDDVTVFFAEKSSFTLSFTKSKDVIKLNKLISRIYLSSDAFPNAKKPDTTQNNEFTFDSTYTVGNGKVGYYCATNLMLGNKTMNIVVTNFKFEAFRNSNGTNFDAKFTTCNKDLSDPMVAIIVGAVLAAFLIVVIILFIVFQIRAKRRQGYQEI